MLRRRFINTLNGAFCTFLGVVFTSGKAFQDSLHKGAQNPEEGTTVYDRAYRKFRKRREQAAKGPILIKGKDQPWEQARQGRLKYFSLPTDEAPGVAESSMIVFLHEIRRHSGKHVHQGGFCIYVVDGEGYSVVDGRRHDWEKGDLLLLPIKPNGVEHQHFNRYPDKPCTWMAIYWGPFFDWMGVQFEQRENSPDWKGSRTR
jgi:quercetin dioxygenase-like cupin family protein